MHILSDKHSRSLFIHFNLIISLLSRISVTSSLRDFPFIRILRQQTAQDTLLTKPLSPSVRCVCSRQISVDLQLPSVRSLGRLGKSQAKSYKDQDFAQSKDIGQRAQLDQEIASQEYVQATFSGDNIASHSNHEWECEKPSGRAQGLRMQAGSHYQSAPNPILAPVDPYEKQKKTEIKK